MLEDDALREWLAGRAPRRIAMATLTETDAEPDPAWMLEPPLQTGTVVEDGVRIGIVQAGSGGLTPRIVHLRRVWHEGGVTYLGGICELRQGWRTFRVDDIRACVIPGSDRRYSVEDLLGALGFDLAASTSVAGYWSRVRACAIVLVALADTDGIVMPAELAAVSRYAEALARSMGLSISDEDMTNFRTALPALSATTESVEVALDAIGHDREALPLFLDAVRSLAESDGGVSDRERRFIERIVSHLRAMA
jgi:tellurite resistance protein